MDTTTAAKTAAVTVATIRRWCRYGAVTATKATGRWNIDEASLRHRITIGRKRVAKYEVREVTKTSIGREYTVYAIVPAGKNNAFGVTYPKREDAEFHVDVADRIPDGYRVSKNSHPARSMRSGYYWKVEGPDGFRHTWDEGNDKIHDATGGDLLVRIALEHAKDAPKRAAKKAVAEAEQAVREARADQLAELQRQKGELATYRQVDYILDLLEQRRITGEGGGFFVGPTDRAGIEELSKNEATMYITSLKGDY
jgi:hypothetical protein